MKPVGNNDFNPLGKGVLEQLGRLQQGFDRLTQGGRSEASHGNADGGRIETASNAAQAWVFKDGKASAVDPERARKVATEMAAKEKVKAILNEVDRLVEHGTVPIDSPEAQQKLTDLINMRQGMANLARAVHDPNYRSN